LGTGGRSWSRLADPSQAEPHPCAGEELLGRKLIRLGEDIIAEWTHGELLKG